MAGPRKTFREGIEENDRQYERRQHKTETIELSRSHDRRERAGRDEENRLPLRYPPGRHLASGGARIPRVDLRVHGTIESHRRAPDADHRHEDPPDLTDRYLSPSGGKDDRAQRERQCEDAVREFDHPPEEDDLLQRSGHSKSVSSQQICEELIRDIHALPPGTAV